MTVRRDGDTIVLEGRCPVDDAETLLQMLQENGDPYVDVTRCSRIHTALLQVLLACGARVRGAGQSQASPWLERLLDTETDKAPRADQPTAE